MKEKRIVRTIFITIFLLIIAYLISTGFMKRTDVALGNFAVSLDGTELTMNVGVTSSAGYIRGFKEKDLNPEQKVLTFYSTFGGINSIFGAKNTYTLQLSPELNEIYFYNSKNSMELKLVKDATTNQWYTPWQLENKSKNIHKIENPNWGVTFEVDDITPWGLYILCTQSGGTPTGELSTESYYIVEKWDEAYGWYEVPIMPQKYPTAWTDEGWIITMDDTTVWYVDWEGIYGKLAEGTYRVGKELTDWRDAGDYDKAMYYAEFEIK